MKNIYNINSKKNIFDAHFNYCYCTAIESLKSLTIFICFVLIVLNRSSILTATLVLDRVKYLLYNLQLFSLHY